MYGTALGIGNPTAFAAQPMLWGASPIGPGIGTTPSGLQPQQYGQQMPFGVGQSLTGLPSVQQIAQLLQLVSQQVQQLTRLEYFQQQQQLQLQQLLQVVPQQLQQVQQTIQLLSHQFQQLQQQSPALQPFGQTVFGPSGVSPSQPWGSSLGWHGGQGPVM